MLFLKNDKIKYFFAFLFFGYYMQGPFYPPGSFISKVLLILLLTFSSLYFILCLKEQKKPMLFWWIFLLVSLHAGACVLSLIQEPVFSRQTERSVILYYKNLFLVLIPFFSVFYLSSRCLISKNNIRIFFLLVLLISIFKYYDNLYNILYLTLREEGEITNNIAYYFVALIPFLILFKDKKFFLYSFSLIIFFFIVSSAKRGAILAGGVAFMILLLQQILGAQDQKRFLINLFSVFFVLVLLGLLGVSIYEGSEYLQKRLMLTLAGDSSGRDSIYSSLFYAWVHADSIWNYLFGLGFLSSYEITNSSAHNDWLELLTSFGLCGVFLLIGFFYSIFREIWNKSISLEYRWCITMIFSIFIINSLVVRVIYSTFDTGVLIILLAYMLGRSAPASKVDQISE